MRHGDPPPRVPPSRVRDADRTRPATWRWVALFTLVLLVVSLWIPVVPSDANASGTPFTVENLVLLGALAALAAWVMPAGGRARLLLAAILLGATLLAWTLDGPLRELLGPPFDVSDSGPG